MIAYIIKSELDKFRRRGWRAYRKRREYVEGMFGYLNTEQNSAVVFLFYPMNHTADLHHCFFEDEDMEDLVDLAKELGLKFLGTIHTHPGFNTCCHPSPGDTDHAVKTNEILTGVVHLFRKGGRAHSNVTFNNSFEPVEVKFIKRMAKKRKKKKKYSY